MKMDRLFKGRHFDQEIIVLCVRWYLRYKLSFQDLAEMMAERRRLYLAHTTRSCLLDPSAMCRSSRSAGTASLAQLGGPWRVDETYVKIRGRWTARAAKRAALKPPELRNCGCSRCGVRFDPPGRAVLRGRLPATRLEPPQTAQSPQSFLRNRWRSSWFSVARGWDRVVLAAGRQRNTCRKLRICD